MAKTATKTASAPKASAPKTSKAAQVAQKKPTLAEGMANPAPGIADIGKGSITETAPAVRGKGNRVVKQGDDVVLHVRSPIAGQTEVLGAVIKVNRDGTIAVRIPNNGHGRPQDFTGVLNAPANGEFWWSWPEGGENLDEARAAEEADEPVDTPAPPA